VTTRLSAKRAKTPLEIVVEVGPDGTVKVCCSLKPAMEMLRFGMQAQLPGVLGQTIWFGRGPHETMPDRKQGGWIAIHSKKSSEIKHDYIHPQENGNRSDVRWVRFLDDSGKGLEIHSLNKPYINFSLWPYSQKDLTNADHIHELPIRDHYTLNLDLTQRGVGDLFSVFYGRDPQYRLMKGKLYRLAFEIRSVLE
jgi:beta-galactosidase